MRLFPDAVRRVHFLKEMMGEESGFYLDIGCGQGMVEAALHSHAVVFIGVDLNLKALEAARSRGLTVVCADAENLPFLDNSFDGCISSEALEHFEKFEQAIMEISRVLKPGATCNITVPYRYCEKVVPRLFHALVDIMYRESEKRWGHVRPGLSLSELQEAFNAANMSLVRGGYDIKFFGAYLMLLWYFLMSQEDTSRFWRFWLKVYLKLVWYTAPFYKLDDFLGGPGFTLWAKFQKKTET
jgi:ubiquinone/menaquinone biosynthesis C-methylase UbiE